MHRSGTSAITKGLQTLGVSLGDNLMEAVPGNNEKGFWEDIDILTINNDILAKIESSWRDLAIFDDAVFLSAKLQQEKEDAITYIQQKLANIDNFGFKDPRTAVLLPFWQDVFQEIGIDVSYLICLRDPLSVSSSLQKRDSLSTITSLLLWAKHLINSVINTGNTRKIVVDYSLLLKNPVHQIERIASKLELTSPHDNESILKEYVDSFLEPRLQHHKIDFATVKDHQEIPEFIFSAYHLLLKAAKDEIDITGAHFQQEWAKIDLEFRKALPFYFGINENEKRKNHLDEIINALNSKNSALNQENVVVRAELQRKAGELQNIRRQLDDIRRQLDDILNSKSWFITKPIRFANRLLSRQSARLQPAVSSVLRMLWEKAPLSIDLKIKTKSHLFSNFPFIFKRSKAYRNWLILSGKPVDTLEKSSNRVPVTTDISSNRVSVKKDKISGNVVVNHQGAQWYIEKQNIEKIHMVKEVSGIKMPVRLIAFYLPQFHPIPENNEWWGYGFTEWTNVKKGNPQFVDHYQPHIPDDIGLGYYDLRDTEVQHRQIKLAKLYGLEGFCFYFYWFAGKKLLEKPVLNYLHDRSLDFPFCLCWANENWTRRWDGLDSDILISQNYSKDDDLAFISYISKYLKDERYIRVQGKPLILVYRPNLLPSAKKTAKRWREWCLNHGIGEIFLAYTQSFESVDPSVYGFDAAVEFPPNNSAPPDLTDKVLPLNDKFEGKVYDWNILVERSQQYKSPRYKLFRSVNPGWDNTARKKNRGIVFVNSTPVGYQKWLYNAINDTTRQVQDHDERLIFVNAWNEWAEGAHLEPDQKYGCAYLEATRMAMTRANLHVPLPNPPHSAALGNTPEQEKIAVVIHTFYPDVFEEIIGYLRCISDDIQLFITAPAAIIEETRRILESDTGKLSYSLLEVENRGRDILPFLQILKRVKQEGFTTVLKIHTKKSQHRQDGSRWRKDIFEKLLLKENFRAALNYLKEHGEVGMIGPAAHIVPMTTYIGSNLARILALSSRMGIDEETALKLPFVAGSMFICRLKALEPLLALEISPYEFEAEAGQVDGTYAHAIERAFSVSLFSAELQLISTARITCSAGTHDGDITEDYAFAEKCR